MSYVIGALIISCCFVLHIVILVIKKIERDNSYNQNIKINGGYPVYGNKTGNNAGLMYEVDEDSETMAIMEPRAHVTSSFINVTIRLENVVTGYVIDFVLDRQVVIGRKTGAKDVDIQFDDSRISAKHCRIYRQGEQFYIQDLESTNHTYLNNCMLEGAVPITYGDVLRIGVTTLKFYCYT